jgi:uncharacterized RDD family membrane protein YckC
VIADGAITARWGRTPGKAMMRIRPLRIDGRRLGFWQALGRAAAVVVPGLLSNFGLIDPLWCLWDENHQCLHDKVLSTIVVTD